MYRITLRFYEELNDCIAPELRKKDIELVFPGARSVKDLIESLGVPHVEVDLILVNGRSVDFSYLVEDGDRISVYPVFESFDIGSVTRLRPAQLREPAFTLDVHLGKLARRLRLLGFDADFERHRDDEDLASVSRANSSILLSRDRGLLMRRDVQRGILIRSTDPGRQIVEVLNRLDLWARCAPFTRCIACNGPLAVPPSGMVDQWKRSGTIPPGVASWSDRYTWCASCGRVYWEGSHYERLAGIVGDIMQEKPSKHD
jgi:uncharacterized protein with PIN domain